MHWVRMRWPERRMEVTLRQDLGSSNDLTSPGLCPLLVGRRWI